MCGGKNDNAVVSPEPIQDLGALPEVGFLSSQTVTPVGSVYPKEGGDTVYDKQAEGGSTAQNSLQIVQREKELGGVGAVEHGEASQAGTDQLCLYLCLHLALGWRRGHTGLEDAYQTQHVEVVVRVYEDDLQLQASVAHGQDAAAQEVIQHLRLTASFDSMKLNDIT